MYPFIIKSLKSWIKVLWSSGCLAACTTDQPIVDQQLINQELPLQIRLNSSKAKVEAWFPAPTPTVRAEV